MRCVLKFFCEPKRTSCSRIRLRAKIVKIFGFIELFFLLKRAKIWNNKPYMVGKGKLLLFQKFPYTFLWRKDVNKDSRDWPSVKKGGNKAFSGRNKALSGCWWCLCRRNKKIRLMTQKNTWCFWRMEWKQWVNRCK